MHLTGSIHSVISIAVEVPADGLFQFVEETSPTRHGLVAPLDVQEVPSQLKMEQIVPTEFTEQSDFLDPE